MHIRLSAYASEVHRYKSKLVNCRLSIWEVQIHPVDLPIHASCEAERREAGRRARDGAARRRAAGGGRRLPSVESQERKGAERDLGGSNLACVDLAGAPK